LAPPLVAATGTSIGARPAVTINASSRRKPASGKVPMLPASDPPPRDSHASGVGAREILEHEGVDG
jgi:hypothetical protein